MSRYFLQAEAEGAMLSIRDVETGNPVGEPMDWDTATRKVMEMNTPKPAPAPTPAAPRCGCRERVERLEKAGGHYLRGMAEIWETLGFADQKEAALKVIEQTRRIMRPEISTQEEE